MKELLIGVGLIVLATPGMVAIVLDTQAGNLRLEVAAVLLGFSAIALLMGTMLASFGWDRVQRERRRKRGR